MTHDYTSHDNIGTTNPKLTTITQNTVELKSSIFLIETTYDSGYLLCLKASSRGGLGEVAALPFLCLGELPALLAPLEMSPLAGEEGGWTTVWVCLYLVCEGRTVLLEPSFR